MRTIIGIIISTFICVMSIRCNRKKTDAEFILSVYKRSDTFQKLKVVYPDSVVYSKGYTAYLKYDNNNHLQNIYGTILGDQYGQKFRINTLKRKDYWLDYGKLIWYQFIDADNNLLYEIKLNFNTEKYFETFNPQVDYTMYKFSNKDTIFKYKFFFTSFPRKDLKASYSFDNKNFTSLNLIESNFMPFLEEVNVEFNKKQPYIIMKTEASNLLIDLPEIQNSKIFIDTVALYNWRINGVKN